VAELRLSPSRLRREGDALAGMPYARHASDHIVTLDSGALMVAFQLQGAAFETADPRDLNDWHVKLNQTWRNLADDRLAVWHHIVRREVQPEVMGGFRSDFARDLSQAYEARLGGRRLFVNELFVSLVLHPGRDPGDRAAALMRRLQTARRQDTEVAPEQIKRLEDAARDLEQYLGRYAPQLPAIG
jgi:type IV secretion system protein VirB4